MFCCTTATGFASVHLANSTTLKEKHEAVKYVLEKIRYDQHEYYIYVDLKMVNFSVGTTVRVRPVPVISVHVG